MFSIVDAANRHAKVALVVYIASGILTVCRWCLFENFSIYEVFNVVDLESAASKSAFTVSLQSVGLGTILHSDALVAVIVILNAVMRLPAI